MAFNPRKYPYSSPKRLAYLEAHHNYLQSLKTHQPKEVQDRLREVAKKLHRIDRGK